MKLTKEKRGTGACEGAWTVARVGALRKLASGKFLASDRGSCAAEGSARWESGRAVRPMFRVANADRRVLAVCVAAGAAMLLCFAAGRAAMTVPDKLPWEPPNLERTVEGRVDINTAGLEELMTLPDIGEARARAIIDDREQNGPFVYPEDLTRVKGIGEGILAGLLDQITTGGQEDAENFSG